jgi:NADH-quinone oxidoreductase subunit G
VRGNGGARVAAVLSPMLSCEEAWLLARFVRGLAPDALLVLGHVPIAGADEQFPKGFVIKAEKCPNRRGVETLLRHLGGPTAEFPAFVARAVEGEFKAAYITGGYPGAWLSPAAGRAVGSIDFLVVHDLFPSGLDEKADIQIPSATWAEREGTFMNCDGLLQAFERALTPLEGVKADGQFLFELAGMTGLYRAAKVRALMADTMPEFKDVFVPQPLPEHQH